MIFALIPLIFLRKRVPINYILLFLFTGCEALMFSAISANLEPQSVLTAIGVLAATLTALFGGALFSPSIKKLIVYLIVALCVGVVMEIVMLVYLFKALFIGYVNIVVYGVLGSIFAGVYVIVDL